MEGGLYAVNQKIMNKKVIIYSTNTCPFCVRAKELLKARQIQYDEIRIDENPEQRQIMEKLSGRRTVPQIFIGTKHVGGFDDLKALSDRGELDQWLA